MRKGGTTITIHERRRLYIVDLHRPATRTVAPVYTIAGAEEEPRPHENRGGDSYEQYDERHDDTLRPYEQYDERHDATYGRTRHSYQDKFVFFRVLVAGSDRKWS